MRLGFCAMLLVAACGRSRPAACVATPPSPEEVRAWARDAVAYGQQFLE